MTPMADPTRAGQLAASSDLVDVAHLVTAYYTGVPDPADVDQQVAFGTSGHRGTSLRTSFNETHILATTQAICDYRREQGYDGPLFIGRDTHGLSEPAWASSMHCRAVERTSAVSVLAMDWTTTGAPPPTRTGPTGTATVAWRFLLSMPPFNLPEGAVEETG